MDNHGVNQPRKRSFLSLLCAGAALISDGYQNSLMTMLNVLLRIDYPIEYTQTIATRISNALLVGEILGQIIIGIICDYMGRKVALTITTMLIVIGSILAAAMNGLTSNGMLWMLVIARGVVGFGAGGEYPASATSTSEAANESTPLNRGPIFVLVTNLPLALGAPLAISVFLIAFSIIGSGYLTLVARVCFIVGAILPITVLFFRLKMSTSSLYKSSAIKKSVPYWLVIKYNWRALLGTCAVWFVYDFVTFPNSFFSAGIISSFVNVDDSGESVKSLRTTAYWQLLLASLSIPGVLIGALLCSKVGRKATLIIGFTGYIVFGLTLGLAYSKISNTLPLFVVFYGLLQSFGNLGPGDMIGLLSTESFPTAVRGTCYGISAAVGKLGAVVGTQTFIPILNHLGSSWTFIIAAMCGGIGILFTMLCIPSDTARDLALKDENFIMFLRANGWTGHTGNSVKHESNISVISIAESNKSPDSKC
ncbi:major facilitator superfamily domain-containing protein [Dipodascopsis uninucleata]